MFKFRIYVYIIPCNQCDDFQHPLPYSASTSTFNTLFPILHPLPLSLSTPSSLFSIHFPIYFHFHFQHPLPYSASTFTFNTLFPILHPLSPSAPTPTPTPPFNSHKFHVLQPPVTASFRFFPRTFILATRHFPIKKLLIHFAHLVPLPLHHSSSLS